MSYSKKPLVIETLRQSLASRNDFERLRDTYKLEFRVENLNQPRFWDKLLGQSSSLNEQDAMTKDRIKTALKFLPKRANKVLDVGAGYGFIEELIQKSCRRVSIYGIDISPLGVRRLKNRYEGNFKVGDTRKIPYSDKSFDAIFALEILEHISPNDTFVALQEIKRTLKPGGSLIISVPTNEVITDFSKNPSGHLRIYTPDLIRAELLLSGFKFIQWKKLYAFNKWYKLKSIFASLFPLKFQPNNVVIQASKPGRSKLQKRPKLN